MKKLLVHACCGPCFAYIEQDLKNNGLVNEDGSYEKVDYTALFYNPNIHPKVEHQRRIEAFKMLCDLTNCKYDILDEYDMHKFTVDVVKNVYLDKKYQKRCEICYLKRLQKVFEYAKENNFDIVTTTLTISPYQNHEIIKEVGEKLSQEYGIEFRYIDYTPHFREGQKVARDMGLYMQKYCGCIYSMDSGKWVY